jgi:glutamate-1-semialdehyde 2,1-aminomutase
MDMLAPNGPVYQAGTLSGNPLAMAAGYTALKILNSHPEIYKSLEIKAQKLAEGFRKNIKETGTKAIVNQIGSLLTLFFNDAPEVTTFEQAAQSDTNQFAEYFRLSLENGIYLAPSQFECAFVSDAHTAQDIEKTIKANRAALEKMAEVK